MPHFLGCQKKIFLEFLKHTHLPCKGIILRVWKFIWLNLMYCRGVGSLQKLGGHKIFPPMNYSNRIMLSLWYEKVGGHKNKKPLRNIYLRWSSFKSNWSIWGCWTNLRQGNASSSSFFFSITFPERLFLPRYIEPPFCNFFFLKSRLDDPGLCVSLSSSFKFIASPLIDYQN